MSMQWKALVAASFLILCGCSIRGGTLSPERDYGPYTGGDDGYHISGVIIDQYGEAFFPSEDGDYTLTVDSSDFYKELHWQRRGDTTTEFWFWLPGKRNLCSGSTEPTCAVDSRPLGELPVDHPVFSDVKQYNLYAVERPRECIPPEILRDLVSSALSSGYGSGDVRLCKDMVYDGLRGNFNDPLEFSVIYADPGVVIKNSYIKAKGFIVHNIVNRVVLDNTFLEVFGYGRLGRISSVNGLTLINNSSLRAGMEAQNRSYKFSNITTQDTSVLSISVRNTDKFYPEDADASSLWISNLKALSKGVGPDWPNGNPATSNHFFAVDEGKLFIENSTIRSNLFLEANTWYGHEIEFKTDSLDIDSALCLFHQPHVRVSPCTTDSLVEAIEADVELHSD